MEKKFQKSVKDMPISADDDKTFPIILAGVIEHFDIKKPCDIMTANRMVANWMKLKYVEGELVKGGLYFKEYDRDGGLKRIKVNELAYYLKQLDSEFRAFYRVLSTNSPMSEQKKEDFLTWLDSTPKK